MTHILVLVYVALALALRYDMRLVLEVVELAECPIPSSLSSTRSNSLVFTMENPKR